MSIGGGKSVRSIKLAIDESSKIPKRKRGRSAMELIKYPLGYQRRDTRVVNVGAVKVGGLNPIVIQSMLTSPTSDLEKCMAEIRSLDRVNCEIIRLSLTSAKDLDAMPFLRKKMASEGIVRPLVADVHFSPQLAIDACEVFEKVRINPGNFIDQPKNSSRTGGMISLEAGKEMLKESIQPLVKNLIRYKRALRIGVNQGSLSSRMIENYGDSPMGMVASAVELIDLLEYEGFDQIVVSLKSSNPAVVLQAYRLLVETLPKDNTIPLHLGVTEAGNGTIGRIKSLAGIGPLLFDGIGDTIRVSLTEECCNEIEYADRIISSLNQKRDLQKKVKCIQRAFNASRCQYGGLNVDDFTLGGATTVKVGKIEGDLLPETSMVFDEDFTYQLDKGKSEIMIQNNVHQISLLSDQSDLEVLTPDVHELLLIDSCDPLYIARQIFEIGEEKRGSCPVGIVFPVLKNLTEEIHLFVQISSVLSEGLIDFILLPQNIPSDYFEKILCLLQATRTRLLAPDYIACPSCGRTLFDLKSTTEKIKQRTSHLKGVKIGIMGCIVNGPGEMADADFGYVGSGKGKVDLYFGKEKVERGILEGDAVEALIALIKKHNMWSEPK